MTSVIDIGTKQLRAALPCAAVFPDGSRVYGPGQRLFDEGVPRKPILLSEGL